MANVSIDASEMSDTSNKFLRLIAHASSDSPELSGDLAELLVDDITTQVYKTFRSTGADDKVQVPLGESFYSFTFGNSTTITSRAPHSKVLEKGATEHPIGPDKAGAISYIPENPGDYPDELMDNGRFTMIPGEPVQWKPDKSATGYGYVEEAQENWKDSLDKRLTIGRHVGRSIRKAGFNRGD